MKSYCEKYRELNNNKRIQFISKVKLRFGIYFPQYCIIFGKVSH